MHVGFSLRTLTSDAPTGTSTYVHGLLGEFARGNGPERTTLLLGSRTAEEFRCFCGEAVQLRVLGGPSRGDPLVARLSALPALRSARGRQGGALTELDVLHYPLTIPAPAARLARVVTLHDVQHHDMPELFSRSQRLWRRFAFDRTARQAHVVITDSEHAKARIVERLGIDPERIEVVHHGVDRTRFSPRADTGALAGYDLPPRYVLYPAGLWPHKNHERLLEALATVKEPSLGAVLTGPTFDRFGELRASITRYRLEERVKCLGVVSRTALSELYRRAEALVFPSLYEGFGAPPIEAMACGCPVACSTSASLPEICGDAALMFDPRSVDAIASAIRRVISDSRLRERLRRSGRERAAHFSWQRAAERHRAAFERALVLDPPSRVRRRA